MEHVKNGKGEFIAKIHIASKKPFFWIRQDVIFKKWLREEKISLEENNLKFIVHHHFWLFDKLLVA
jgi:hypothetical protein